MFGSPETTQGGRALKFYSSTRIDIRRIETIKDGQESIGNRVRAKIVKNKVAPPFRLAEFDIMFGTGISREGSLLDVAVEHDVVRKSGAWYTYEDDQLGQGRENSKRFLRENPEIAMQLQAQVLAIVGLTESDADAEEPDDEAAPSPAADEASAATAEGSASAEPAAKKSAKTKAPTSPSATAGTIEKVDGLEDKD